MSLKTLTVIAAAIAAAALLISAQREREAREARLTAEATRVAAAYGKDLLAAVKGALETSGPTGAVRVCKEQAPVIAAEHGKATGWRIARTSLKPRNAASAPDPWERAVMEDFATRIAAGAPPAGLVRTATIDTDDGPVFRYIKAIPTGEPCLLCHGTDLKPDVVAALKAAYPDDKATGFGVGEMRGAFTLVRWP